MAFQWDLGASNLKAISDHTLLKMFPKYSLSEEQVRAFKVRDFSLSCFLEDFTWKKFTFTRPKFSIR